jgi:hypothetical protein
MIILPKILWERGHDVISPLWAADILITSAISLLMFGLCRRIESLSGIKVTVVCDHQATMVSQNRLIQPYGMSNSGKLAKRKGHLLRYN